MKHRAFAPVLALVLAPVLPASSPGAGEPAPARPAQTLDTVAWLAGSWQGSIGGDALEESWLPPAGGAMVGLHRWLKGGEVYLYELMSFEETEEGLVLKIKHFGPGLVGREEKEESILFDLVEAADGRSVFAERDDEQERTRLTYRPEGEDGMVVIFEEERAGKPVSLTFRYRRR